MNALKFVASSDKVNSCSVQIRLFCISAIESRLYSWDL